MVLGIGTAISDMMVKGFQSPVFGSPSQHNLEFEDVEFPTSDGVVLRGWLINPNTTSNKIIIQSHYGVQCCRSGYTPEGKGLFPAYPDKIEFLQAVPTYIQAGYAMLMYDLRNHGNSDTGTCEYVSWGPNEAADVIAAVEYCSKKYKSIYLLSVCMGGAATTYAYGLGEEDGLSQYNDKIHALVVIQPLTYKQMITNMGMPKWLENMSVPVSKGRLGFDLNEKSFFGDAKNITVPTMVVQNNHDNFHKHEEVQEYFDTLGAKQKEMVWLDLEKGRFHNYAWLATNEGAEKVVSWFNKY